MELTDSIVATLFTQSDKFVQNLTEHLSASVFVKLFCQLHSSVDVKVILQALLELIFRHQADVDKVVKLRCVGEGFLCDHVLVRKLFEHKVEEVDAGVGLSAELELESVDSLFVGRRVLINVVAGGHIENKLRQPRLPFLERQIEEVAVKRL